MSAVAMTALAYHRRRPTQRVSTAATWSGPARTWVGMWYNIGP